MQLLHHVEPVPAEAKVVLLGASAAPWPPCADGAVVVGGGGLLAEAGGAWGTTAGKAARACLWPPMCTMAASCAAIGNATLVPTQCQRGTGHVRSRENGLKRRGRQKLARHVCDISLHSIIPTNMDARLQQTCRASMTVRYTVQPCTLFDM